MCLISQCAEICSVLAHEDWIYGISQRTHLVEIRHKAIKIAKEASQLDAEKKYEEAVTKYIECIELFKHVIKCIHLLIIDTENKDIKETLLQKANEYLNRALEIKRDLKRNKEDLAKKEAAEGSESSNEKEYYHVIIL